MCFVRLVRILGTCTSVSLLARYCGQRHTVLLIYLVRGLRSDQSAHAGYTYGMNIINHLQTLVQAYIPYHCYPPSGIFYRVGLLAKAFFKNGATVPLPRQPRLKLMRHTHTQA